ncbi:hypothetical protein ACP4OV_001369 [Aristida adscensionis]
MSCYSIAYGGDRHGFVAVPTSSLESETICSTSTASAGAKPRSRVPATAAPPRSVRAVTVHQQAVLRREAPPQPHPREHIKSTMRIQDGDKVNIPTHLGNAVDSLEYVVTVGMGTPAVPQVVVVDTGSDLSWVQCNPCDAGVCSPQKDPLFDPSHSSTYRPIPCGSDACNKLAADAYTNGCQKGEQCTFAIEYADGSNTRGVYSAETLTLAPGVAVKNFRFGCGRDQRQTGKFDGLLGLGRLPESLEEQYGSRGGGAFSYCVPAVDSKPGFLTLGVGKNPSGFAFTPMGKIPGQPTFYTVTLIGITVAGKKLDLPPSAFDRGMIVDSGTVITGLQTVPYMTLRLALLEAMAAYPLDPLGRLDTCFNFTGFKSVTVPKVTLTFSGGATIDLDVPNGILVEGCLAFMETGPGSPGFLGNVNQRTFEVLYDAGRSRMGFRAKAC